MQYSNASDLAVPFSFFDWREKKSTTCPESSILLSSFTFFLEILSCCPFCHPVWIRAYSSLNSLRYQQREAQAQMDLSQAVAMKDPALLGSSML